jgi:spermidine synthase
VTADTFPETTADVHAPADEGDAARPARRGLLSERVRLVMLSFLMLFVELALIRWAGANILYLSYFSNLILLGSFLGIGLGFLWAGKGGRPLFPFTPIALAALVAFIRFFPVKVTVSGTELIFFNNLKRSGLPREVVLPIIFAAVAATMFFLADGVARAFSRFDHLVAYRLDLIGSVLGILAFSALSVLWLPPLAWGVVVVVLLGLLLLPRLGWTELLGLAALILVLVLLGSESFDRHTSWSSYYKVQWYPTADGYGVNVNGIPHQSSVKAEDNPLYTATFGTVVPRPPGRVLIIGAGGGNDVAAALAKGATRVDAVEIDRHLYELGRDHHPSHPYAGRAFLERSTQKWDRIQLALPDSLTLVTGQSSVRLESYLFTAEAAKTYRRHLAPGGVFSMYNYYRESWLVDRYASTLDQAFAHPPCVITIDPRTNYKLAVLLGSEDPSAINCTGAGRAVWQRGGGPGPVGDDRPFPYLRVRTIPVFYLETIALILLASVLAVLAVLGRHPMQAVRELRTYLDLFFMGAAFALLETKNVVQFALLFGTTWLVNALVFLGVLVSVLAAVAVAQRVTFRHPMRLYALLITGLLVAYFIPPHVLLELAVVPRFGAAATLAFLPIFTANLIFSQRFKQTASSVTSFGANLLGVMVGGTLEYLSLVTGYRNLLLVVALLYGLALVAGRRELAAGAQAGAAERERSVEAGVVGAPG